MAAASRMRRLGLGLSSLALLVFVTVGVPIALWAMAGSPLPAGIVSPHEIANALSRSNIPDSTLVKVVALIGWAAWLQVAASVAVEVAAWARGRPAPHLPLGGTVQPIVRRLVASAALVLSSAHVPPTVAAVALAPKPAAAIHVSATTQIDAAAVEQSGALPTHEQKLGALPRYTVVRYDTLWGLAERHLGDPFRWREIYELNRGVRQVDGRVLEDPDLIFPGWTLALPSDATGVEPARVVVPEQVPPVPPTTPSPTPGAHKHNGGGSQPKPRATAAPSTTTTPPSTAAVHSQGDGSSQANGRSTHEPGNASPREHPGPLVFVGGALAAASLVALLDRLRRVQRRRRRTGTRPPAPTATREATELALRQAANLDEAELLDLGLRGLRRGCGFLATSASHRPRRASSFRAPRVAARQRATGHPEGIRSDGGQAELDLGPKPQRRRPACIGERLRCASPRAGHARRHGRPPPRRHRNGRHADDRRWRHAIRIACPPDRHGACDKYVG